MPPISFTLNPNAPVFVPQSMRTVVQRPLSPLADSYQAIKDYVNQQKSEHPIDGHPSTVLINLAAEESELLLNNLYISLQEALEPFVALGCLSTTYRQYQSDQYKFFEAIRADIEHILSHMPADERKALCEIMGSDPLHLKPFILSAFSSNHPAVFELEQLIRRSQPAQEQPEPPSMPQPPDLTPQASLPPEIEPVLDADPIPAQNNEPSAPRPGKKRHGTKPGNQGQLPTAVAVDNDTLLLEQTIANNQLTLEQQSAIEYAQTVDKVLDDFFKTPFKSTSQNTRKKSNSFMGHMTGGRLDARQGVRGLNLQPQPHMDNRQVWVNAVLAKMTPKELVSLVLTCGTTHYHQPPQDKSSPLKPGKKQIADNNQQQNVCDDLVINERTLLKPRSQIEKNLMDLAVHTIAGWPPFAPADQHLNTTAKQLKELALSVDFSKSPFLNGVKAEQLALRMLLCVTRVEFLAAACILRGSNGFERADQTQRTEHANIFLFNNGMQNYHMLCTRLSEVPVIGPELSSLFADHLTWRGAGLLVTKTLTLHTLENMCDPFELNYYSRQKIQEMVSTHHERIQSQKRQIKGELAKIINRIQKQHFGYLQPTPSAGGVLKMEACVGRQIAHGICMKAHELLSAEQPAP